ncbi:MAG: phage tail tube protein [Pseudolabrys sp.]
MPSPIRWESKVLLAKIESAYATDPTLTGAANAILATEVELRPMEGEDKERNLDRPYMGAQPSLLSGIRSVLTFNTELQGSGVAGTAPAWGPLARGCGMAETIVALTSVTYNPISSAMESLYFKLWIESTLYALKGSRGTAQLTVNAQGIPVIRWTFTGLFVPASEGAPASPTLTGFKDPLLATTTNTPTFTVNGVALVMRDFSLDLGNDVQPRLLIGRDEIRIVNRREQINCVVEAVPVSTLNPYTLANAATLVPLSLVHGTVAGGIITVSAPKCQIRRPTGLQNNQNITEWPLQLAPMPNAGNDQFTIALT